MEIAERLNKEHLSFEDLVALLSADENESNVIFERARDIKERVVSNNLYLRGIIEISNICRKNCLYCGIRKDNQQIKRYNMDDDDVLEVIRRAYEMNISSLVIQSGELKTTSFINRIDNLLKEVKKLSNGKIGITLSCGEQDKDTYRRWFESGAHRYLLRIETSNRSLYQKIHPYDQAHVFDERIQALFDLKETGYQVGTGVMIGLPFQTYENLAADLQFMKKLDIDMCGMGPYIEHEATPLYKYRNLLYPLEERLQLSFKMIALLRILMNDINIAATTALQAIHRYGRERAFLCGANVVMPNITPLVYRDDYKLYKNKPGLKLDADDSIKQIGVNFGNIGAHLKIDQWGDSLHFAKRKAQVS